MKRSKWMLIGWALALFGVWAVRPPVPVSPGLGDEALVVDSRCPTFQWSAVEGARGYQLAVYRLGDDPEDVEPVLLQELPAASTGWTPSLDRCLERGREYAWAVRTLDGEEPEWSEAHLFEVPEGPSEAEIGAAIGALRDRRDEGAERVAPPRRGLPAADRRIAPRALAGSDRPTRVASSGSVAPTFSGSAGLQAINGATAGYGHGVVGLTQSGDSGAAGVYGEGVDNESFAFGVFGVTSSPYGTGSRGYNVAGGDTICVVDSFDHAAGVVGESDHIDGVGVVAISRGGEGAGLIASAYGGRAVVEVFGGEGFLDPDNKPDLIKAYSDSFQERFRVDYDGNLTATSVTADTLTVDVLDFSAMDVLGALTNSVYEQASGGTASVATCPSGELMTGGGCECGGGGSVVESIPSGSDGWRCQCPAGNLSKAWTVCLATASEM